MTYCVTVVVGVAVIMGSGMMICAAFAKAFTANVAMILGIAATQSSNGSVVRLAERLPLDSVGECFVGCELRHMS